MGKPLVRRLTVRSGVHPDSGAPAHQAILHVSPDVAPPGRAELSKQDKQGADRPGRHAPPAQLVSHGCSFFP